MDASMVSRLKSSLLYQWAKSHPITVVASCIFLGYLVSYLLAPVSPWADLYLRAGQQMIQGENVYLQKLGFAYPPCRAMVMMPFLVLPSWGQQIAWWACNVLCLVLMCRWMWQIAGGTRLEPMARWTAEHTIWLVGILTGIFYVFNGMSNQATDIFETTIMLAGCLALMSNRPLQAATWLGIAAGLKATPLLWCVYLIWRRQWTATAWLVTVALGINLLPDLISQCPTSATWLGGWVQQYLGQFQNANYTPGSWGSHVYYNQSLAGMMNRFFLSDWTWSNGTLQVISLTPAISPQYYKLGLLGVEAVLLGLCAWGWWKRTPASNDAKPGMVSPSTDKPWHPTGRATSIELGLEFSMVMMLMLLFSPMSSKSHFCGLILPGMLLARVAWEQQSRWLGTLFITANVIGFISLTWWGEYVARVSLYYGTVTFKTLILLAGCGVALSLLRRRTKGEAESSDQSTLPKLAA